MKKNAINLKQLVDELIQAYNDLRAEKITLMEAKSIMKRAEKIVNKHKARIK